MRLDTQNAADKQIIQILFVELREDAWIVGFEVTVAAVESE